MNSYQLQELIKNIQAMMRCPSCGANYEEDNIHFLGQLDMAALIQLDCQSCDLPVMATILVSGKQETPRIMSDLVKEDLTNASPEPVSGDDAVDLHSELKDFDGDFEKLFG